MPVKDGRRSRWRVRRGGAFLAGAVVLGLLAPGLACAGSPQSARAPEMARFRDWLAGLERTRGEIAGLYPYFSSEDPAHIPPRDDFISPMVSAKVALFWLAEGEIERARRTGARLLYWQSLRGSRHPHAAGALPSEIRWKDSRWQSGDHHYSGDNLVILEAFLAIHRATGDPGFLRGAAHIASWLRDVMCRGTEFGVWRDDHGAPMNFVTATGEFDARIFTNVSLLWIVALRKFGEVSGDDSHLRQFEKAAAFLLRGQSPLGVWYDHYDPGYPPKAYRPDRWRWYDESGLVVADNTLRAALGAHRIGALGQARAFADWFRPDAGGVPAYLDVRTARGRFDPTTPPYYDVVASGLWRTLATALGRSEAEREAMGFLAATQNPGGGWFWGLVQKQRAPIQPVEAILTGLWAVSDMGVLAQEGGPRR